MTPPVIKSGLVDDGLHISHRAKAGARVLMVGFAGGDLTDKCTSFTLQVGERAHLYDPIIKHLNHHCEPSIRLDVEVDDMGLSCVTGYALRDLEPGDELTFNYMTMDMTQAQGGMVCLCGSDQCFGILNGWDGLTPEQQVRLAPITGGFVKEAMMRDRESKLKDLHNTMGDGTMELCGMFIQQGNCQCCKFHFGNWIGLLPGEMDYLKNGDTSGRSPAEGTTTEGITCQRDPATCFTDKPLDCKLYPFFPYAVTDEGDHYRVLLGAGDQKCSGKAMIISALRGTTVQKGATLPFADHAYNVAKTGVQLFLQGHAAWMHDTFAGYVGYSTGYSAIVLKGDENA